MGSGGRVGGAEDCCQSPELKLIDKGLPRWTNLSTRPREKELMT